MKKRWSNSKSIKWDESQILGRGCEGTVVFSGHFNEQPVAVKRVLLTNNVQQVDRELEALLHLNHPRIVQLFHFEKEFPFLYVLKFFLVCSIFCFSLNSYQYVGDLH